MCCVSASHKRVRVEESFGSRHSDRCRQFLQGIPQEIFVARLAIKRENWAKPLGAMSLQVV